MSEAGRGMVLKAPFRARRTPLGLAELFDIELQWRQDRSVDPDDLAKRDAAVFRDLPEGAAPEDVLRQWLARVYAGKKRPGAFVEGTLKQAGIWLGVLGAVTGAATTAALLAAGTRGGDLTANVAHILAVLVGLQLLLLVFLLCHLPPWRGEASTARPGPARTGLKVGLLRALMRQAQKWEKADHARAALGLPEPAERSTPLATPPATPLATPLQTPALWRLVALLQTFGVWFNLGALATLVALVTFTDLAFSWSTTLAATPEAVKRLTDAVSLPWAAFWPSARPSAAVIAETRLYKLAPARVDPLAARAWWPFVTAAVVFYGLLPRLLMRAVATRAARRTLAEATFASAEATEFARRSQARSDQGAAAPTRALPADVTTCGVVVWRDVPAGDSALAGVAAGATGLEVRWLGRAGGTRGDLGGVAANARIKAEAPGALVLVVDEFETLDKGLRRFLAGATADAPNLPVVVVPVKAPSQAGQNAATEPARLATDPRRLAAWASALAKGGDGMTLLAGFRSGSTKSLSVRHGPGEPEASPL